MTQPTITVAGLKEFSKAMRRVDAEAAKGIRLVNNEAAQVVVDKARPRIPRVTGRAAGSLKLRSTRTLVRISMGGPRAPYYPWLDFGGRTGIRRSVIREFIKTGRYIYPALYESQDQVRFVMERGLLRIARQAGLEVD